MSSSTPPSSSAPTSPPAFNPPSPAVVDSGELSKQYRPSEHEKRVWDRWIAAKAFHADPTRVVRGEAKPYSILIPPPNVTAALHLGHALNNTLQDILTRVHRMRGYETLWMPGTDHAGIATQAVVEKRLRKEGKLKGALKTAMKRDEFVAHVQAFKDEYEAVITEQLKAMGCSCDWDRQRFTMDETCARAVREAFFRLFKDGLIYRGKRLVNWDPALQTAVADDECYDEEIDGAFYYLRYPLVREGEEAKERKSEEGKNAHLASSPSLASSLPRSFAPVTWDELAARGYPGATQHPADAPAWITVATTRPETYLGDVAVAINPHDPRAKALRGLMCELPIVGRVIPILEDDYVVLPERYARSDEEKNDPKAKMATGFLKVTPAHDQNDYELGQRHKAAIEALGNAVLINVMAPDGSISDKHGWTDVNGAHIFVGKKREDARKLVIQEFKARTVGNEPLFEGSTPHRHSVKHSDRSKAIVEPYLSDQWYVKVTDPRLAACANAALTPEQRTTGGGKGLSTNDVGATSNSVGATSNGVGAIVNAEGVSVNAIGAMVNDKGASANAKGTSARLGASPDSGKGPGTEDGDGALRFYPSRYAKTYEQWHDNIRDWCISRQLWWGHRIPVWISSKEAADDAEESVRLGRFVDQGRIAITESDDNQLTFVCVRSESDHEAIKAINADVFGYVQDPDVLDTWFSSALWPLSTMGWPDAAQAAKETGLADMPSLLPAFNPTSTLCTAREIITLWVSRMVMFNRYLRSEGAIERGSEGGKDIPASASSPSSLPRSIAGPIPFFHVYIHAVVQDGEGRKMSKSLGNGVDPLDIIATHGSDAMRFTVCQMATQTQDVRLPVKKDAQGRNTSEKFDLGRNFANKLWNAARFAMGILGTDAGTNGTGAAASMSKPAKATTLTDRWLLSRLSAAVAACDAALAEYQFSNYAQIVYDLLWRDFCDWYLEAIKPTVATSASQRAVLRTAIEAIVRLLHPVMPFVTEAIYEKLSLIPLVPVEGVTLTPPTKGGGAGLLATAGWSIVSEKLGDPDAEAEFGRIRELIEKVREVRAERKVTPKHKVVLHLPAGKDRPIGGEFGNASMTEEAVVLIQTLAGVEAITTHAPAADAGPVATFMFEGAEHRVSKLVDPAAAAAVGDAGDAKAAEIDRLKKLIAGLQKEVATLRGRLANPGYTAKAPPHMVEETKQLLSKKEAELAAAEAQLKAIG